MSTSSILKSFDLKNYSLSVLSTNAPPIVKFISGQLFTWMQNRFSCLSSWFAEKKSFIQIGQFLWPDTKAMISYSRVDQAPPLHPSFNGISSTHVISKSLSPCLFDKSLFKSIFFHASVAEQGIAAQPIHPHTVVRKSRDRATRICK